MMAAATAVMGLGTGKRLLTGSTFVCHAGLSDKHSSGGGGGGGGGDGAGNVDQGIIGGSSSSSSSSPSKPHIMFAVNSNPNRSSAYFVRALRCHHTSSSSSAAAAAAEIGNASEELEADDDEGFDLHSSVEALLLLQKSMLEKQWTLPFVGTPAEAVPGNARPRPSPQPDPTPTPTPKAAVTCSGTSARQRRMSAKRKIHNTRGSGDNSVSPQLLKTRPSGYVKGAVTEQLLSHAEVVQLSKFIQVGLNMEDHKSRLKERLGCEPSNEQLAAALRMSHAELQSKLIECSLAREKLAMSNVRLVMSIAQKYNGMGAEMADLVQGGLVGLLRGIEKFDSSKGFKISTYVYWWIRQGVASALVDNARTLRLPKHLHERLSLIKHAKIALEEKGIVPSIDKIAESLNMSKTKVKNATEAVSQVFSLDRQAFPSLSGIPGETLHSYIADNRSENDPWHGVGDWALKDEVNNLLDSTLGARERDIIRLYYGLDGHPLSWEDISKRIGLSRERVRQVGLVAMEKLKHAARKRRLEAMLITR